MRRESAWLADAMARATTMRAVATANVIRMPAATASGCAVMMSVVADPRANTVPIRDAPEIARQVEQAGYDAPLVRWNIRHDGGVVGRLEQRIAGGDD